MLCSTASQGHQLSEERLSFQRSTPEEGIEGLQTINK